MMKLFCVFIRHGGRPGPGTYEENGYYVYLGCLKKKFTPITYRMAPLSGTSRIKINELIQEVYQSPPKPTKGGS